MQTKTSPNCKLITDYTIHFHPSIYQYLQQSFGKEHFAKLSKVLTIPPSITTIRINDITQQKQAITILSQKVNTDKITIDPHLPDCLRIPITGPHKVNGPLDQFVVVGAKCGEAVLRGSNVFAPGVLGMSKYAKKNNKVSILCCTRLDSITKGKKLAMDEIAEFLFIGNGILRMDHFEIFHGAKKGIAVETTESIFHG